MVDGECVSADKSSWEERTSAKSCFLPQGKFEVSFVSRQKKSD